MKKIILLFFISLFIFPLGMKAQKIDQESRKFLYERKVITFTKMRNSGMHLTFGGILLTMGGIALMVDGAEKMGRSNNYYSDSVDGEGEFLVGYLAGCLGVGATTGGIVLWSIGGSKSKSYQRKLNSLSFNLNPGPKQTFTLAYTF